MIPAKTPWKMPEKIPSKNLKEPWKIPKRIPAKTSGKMPEKTAKNL